MKPISEYIKSVEQINQSAHNEALKQLDYDLLAACAAMEINMVAMVKNQENMQRIHIRYYSHICGTEKIKEILNSLYRWGYVSEIKIEVSTHNDLECYLDIHHPKITEFVAQAMELIECGYVMSELDRPNQVYVRIHSKNHPQI